MYASWQRGTPALVVQTSFCFPSSYATMDAFAAARSLRGHVSSINVLAFSPDGRLLASGADDNHIIIYDLLSFEQVQRIDGLAPVTSLLWSADVEQLYAGFGDGRVLIVSISLSMVGPLHDLFVPS